MVEGEGEMIWENNIKTCILSSVKQVASETDAWDMCSGLVHWDDPEGWDGEGGERGDQDGNTCKSMADSCQCMTKTTRIS